MSARRKAVIVSHSRDHAIAPLLKKRILQLIGSFHEGGSERQAVALTRALRTDATFDVSVATLNKRGVLLGESIDLDPDEIPEFPLTSFYDLDFLRQLRAFARHLTACKVDLIHTHDFYTNVFGMAAASLARTDAKVASKRETLAMRSRPQEIVERLAFGRADAVVANSVAVRDHLIERSVPATKIDVIYNGVDLSRFEESGSRVSAFKDSIGLNGGDRLITLVANLRHPVKDVPMFLRAAKLVSEAAVSVNFAIAGEGELETDLKALASELGVAKSTHFLGRCADVPALLSASCACVLTSKAEGFSNSIIEYMAAGKPVVATRVGGAAEAILEGETGYLVDPGDDEGMAKRLIELLNDGEQAAVMGAQGRSRAASEFSAKAQLKKTLELYDSCLGN